MPKMAPLRDAENESFIILESESNNKLHLSSEYCCLLKRIKVDIYL